MLLEALLEAAGRATASANINPKDIPGNVPILGSTRVRLTAIIIIFAFVFEGLRTYGIEISSDTQYTIYAALGLLMGTDMARPVGHRVKAGAGPAASIDAGATGPVDLPESPQ